MKLIREFHGSNFYTPRSGWFLSADLKVWQAYGSIHRVMIFGLLSDLAIFLGETFTGFKPSVHCSPFEACLELADWLLGPIDLKIQFFPGANKLEAGCFVFSSYHDLAGESLRSSVSVLFDFFQNSIDGHVVTLQCDSALSLMRRAELIMADAFSNAVVVHAAQLGLNIDFHVPIIGQFPLLQIGLGANSRILSATGTDRDSYIGVRLCGQKPKCNEFLRALGCQVPKSVYLEGKLSFDTIIQKASAIGFPCVVKPSDRDNGIGVTTDVCDSTALLQAVERAGASTSMGVLIEEQVPGDYYRLYVIGGDLISIKRMRPPFLLGDGIRSVQDILNSPSSPSELPGGVVTGSVVSIEDPSVLSQLALQGLSAESIPKSGQRVVIRSDLVDRQDWSSKSFDSKIDFSLSSMARRISRALGLENVGIDVISTDITSLCSSRKIWVIDVNPFQLLHPAWATIFLDQVFSVCEEAKIQIKVIVFSGDTLDFADLLNSLNEQPYNIWAVPKNLVDKHVLADDILNHELFYCYKHPREVLLNRDLQSAVFLIDWHELSQTGLPVMYIDQLQMIGSLSGTRLEQWNNLSIRLGLSKSSQSYCNLFHDSCVTHGNSA